MELSGWIVVDKPLGFSSADVTNCLKRRVKPSKIGHGGTLDPAATGVLPVAIGEATKSMAFMLDADKTYAFTVRFGTQTHSDDATGQSIATHTHRPTVAEIEAILPQFSGEIEQIPPAVSALWVEGQRAYMLAHKGQQPNLQSRVVTVHKLSRLACGGQGAQPPSGVAAVPAQAGTTAFIPTPDDIEWATFTATVSKGTYIRSLARDMAAALGTVGHVSMLQRIQHGPFTLAQAISLDDAQEILDAAAKSGQKPEILPVDAGLDGLPALVIAPEQALKLRQGQTITLPNATEGLARVYAGEGAPDKLTAIVKVEGQTAKPQRVFNL